MTDKFQVESLVLAVNITILIPRTKKKKQSLEDLCMHTSPALYLSNAKKRYFLALNLLRIDSSLDILAECHRKKCAIFIFLSTFA